MNFLIVKIMMILTTSLPKSIGDPLVLRGPAPKMEDLITLEEEYTPKETTSKRKSSLTGIEIQNKKKQDEKFLKRSTSAKINEIESEYKRGQRLGQNRNSVLFLPEKRSREENEVEIVSAINPNVQDRMSKLSSLKKHIQTQWDNAHHLSDGTLSLNSNFRKKIL